MLPHYRRAIAIALGILITAVFIIGIPAFCPGFPDPVVTQVRLADTSNAGGELSNFFVESQIINQGSDGNIIIITKLVNASRNSVEGKSTRMLFMKAKENRTVQTYVSGPGRAPCQIVVDASRRTSLTREF